MSKQSRPIRKQCESRAQCERDAVYGLYTWTEGQTDVNLDRPVHVFCGRHKPRLERNRLARNVRILR